ncbi:MAG TPA: hypothetical protein VHO06_24445 [Polyangia bacterium]|nr:hypothetical protein [Polyangia bacterium]
MTPKVPRPIRIPIPLVRRPIGLGQTIKRLTAAVGVRPCGGCARRARLLDKHVVLTPFKSRH